MLATRSRALPSGAWRQGLNGLGPSGKEAPGPALQLFPPEAQKVTAIVSRSVEIRRFVTGQYTLWLRLGKAQVGGSIPPCGFNLKGANRPNAFMEDAAERRIPRRVRGRPRREGRPEPLGIYGERRTFDSRVRALKESDLRKVCGASALDDCCLPSPDPMPRGRAISLELSDCTSWRDPAPTRAQRPIRSGPRAGRPARNPAVLQGG